MKSHRRVNGVISGRNLAYTLGMWCTFLYLAHYFYIIHIYFIPEVGEEKRGAQRLVHGEPEK